MSDWIEWKGGECPVPDRTEVRVRCRDGYETQNEARCFHGPLNDDCDWWSHDQPATGWPGRERAADIIAYRIVDEARSLSKEIGDA